MNRLSTVFRYQQARQPRYILALDRSSPMDERDNWKYVRSATRRLVLHDLADETELGILSFAAGGSVTIHTQDVANLSLAGSREKVASQIPVYLRDPVTSLQESCLTCAVHSALTVISQFNLFNLFSLTLFTLFTSLTSIINLFIKIVQFSTTYSTYSHYSST